MDTKDTKCRRLPDFVSTEVYIKAKRFMGERKEVLFLHGLSGSGKTEIAKTLGADYDGFLIHCADMRSMKNSLIEICNNNNLHVTFPADCYPLKRFLESAASADRFLILDDVEDIDSLLSAILMKQPSTKIVVTTQRNVAAYEFFSRIKPEDRLKIEGFTTEEAKDYLNIPYNLLNELLEHIGHLPIALRVFKGAFQSIKLYSPQDIIKQYLADMDKGEESPALRCIAEGLKRALADNPFYEKLVKHLSMFSRNYITADILFTLTEELGESQRVANQFVGCLDNRSLCDISQSDTGHISITLHTLVKKAMERYVRADEHDTVIRLSLQAFSRIMPLDDRNHQYFLFPKMLKHGISLLKKLNKKGYLPSPLTRLLHGQLLTSIGYCMISHSHDAADVLKILEDGLEVFLKLLLNHSSRNLEAIGELFLRDPQNTLLLDDSAYEPYIGTLKKLYRITPRDFEELFHEKYDKFDERLEDGHLTANAIDELSSKGLLLPDATLVKIYPLELLAFHLHVLSWAYAYPSANGNDHMTKALNAAKKADVIYDHLKQHGAPLLAMYINKRDYLTLQKDGDMYSLSREWEALFKAEGRAYEWGMTRIKDMKEDKYHQLLCLQGLLHVCGRKAKDQNQRETAVRESEDLIRRIIDLCNEHKRKHITLSKAYQHIAEFYGSHGRYHHAISYLINSMIEYHKYCLESRKGEFGHPELEDDMRKKFDAIHDQLKHCIAKSPEPYQERRSDAVEYLTNLDRSWQKRCKLTQACGIETFSVLLSLVETTPESEVDDL